MIKYIIVWVNEDTEYQGQTEEPCSKRVAEITCRVMNERYPHIRHEAIELEKVTNAPTNNE